MYNARPSPTTRNIEDIRRFLDGEFREIQRVFEAIGRNAYTPVWASTATQPVLGNGTINAGFVTIGNWMEIQFRLVIGSTTTFGTGTYTFSLPRGAAAGAGTWTGTATAHDVSSGIVVVGAPHLNADSAVTDIFTVYFDNVVGVASPTVPFTWATGDQLIATLGFALR